MSSVNQSTDCIVHSTPCKITAADGVILHGHLWCTDQQLAHTALMINAATGVVARYYSRYAAYLARAGFLVLTYDYRGIGLSRPKSLRGFRATKHDWGALDCEAALQFLHAQAPDLPMSAVCHSIGGFVLGLAPSARRIQRAFFVGCQYAYWQDYRLSVRLFMWMNWHLVMPLLTKLFGYFPGKRLGWLEDLPAGVAMEWATRFHPSFHRRYHALPHAHPPAHAQALEARMSGIQADILAIADTRDPFATPNATRRLLAHFRQSHREFARIDVRRNQLPKLGHFGFFHDRFANSLWPQSLAWLQGEAHPWPRNFYWPADSTP